MVSASMTVEDEVEGVTPDTLGGQPVDDQQAAHDEVEADLLGDLASAGGLGWLVCFDDAAWDVEPWPVVGNDEEDVSALVADQCSGGDALAWHTRSYADVELAFGLAFLTQVVGQAHVVERNEAGRLRRLVHRACARDVGRSPDSDRDERRRKLWTSRASARAWLRWWNRRSSGRRRR
jgi:hypothetical protein